MAKIEIGKGRAYYPMPCSLVGANVAGKPNYLTVAWFTMVNPKPPYVALAMNKTHHTNAGIKENGTFSLNIPSTKIVEATDYCGIFSGKNVDKGSVFQTSYGILKTAPMIRECPFSIECKLVQTIDLPAEELFIGEVMAAYCDEACLTGGAPDLRKIDPFLLVMQPESKYLALGKEIGTAWKMGKEFKKK